jgi:MFS family permease
MSLLSQRQAVLVFLAFAFAYFLSALLRAITATLSPALTAEFDLHARDLGLLAGGYFLGFSAIQLPLGTWLDRHGPKKVILGFLSVAVVGCAAFALAQGFYGLLAARILCGAGVGACLMAPLTGYRRWFAPTAQLRTNSWMLMTGSFGMLASTLPVQWLMPVLGWRPLFWGLGALVALSMVLIAWKTPAWDSGGGGPPPPAGGYAEVWRHPYFRRMAPVAFVSYGGMIAVQTLWAGPWMVRVAGYTPVQAATGLFVINGIMLATFWAWGLVTPTLTRRGITTERLIAWGLPAGLVVLGGLVALGPEAGALTLALFCVGSTSVSLAQPAVGMVFPPALAGRALSAFNLGIFMGVFAIQWGIGLLIDGFQAAGLGEADAFRGAFAVFGAASLLSYLFFLFGGDGHNRDQHP